LKKLLRKNKELKQQIEQMQSEQHLDEYEHLKNTKSSDEIMVVGETNGLNNELMGGGRALIQSLCRDNSAEMRGFMIHLITAATVITYD
uniref:Kinesin motor domain-containing protein n=1 Tax=Anisakis simplex TaxID=6269 RepID=A0A0M3KJ19_ANISI